LRVFSKISELRSALGALRQHNRSVGFVPTMGYLHAGHMELVSRARAQNDMLVASIFVNPLQFGPSEDLGKYPRDLERDAEMLKQAGVNMLFAPAVSDMYPEPMLTSVDVHPIGDQLEGAVRPGHFAGVATVICKLFNIVQPHRAYFGEKDYQQVVVIKRMTADLALPVEIVAVPTVRDKDSLALSSRNVYLGAAERRAAVIIPRTLDEAERLVTDGISDPGELEDRLKAFLANEPLANPEIVAVRDASTLQPVSAIKDPVVIALFVRIGTTRLLDNRVIGNRAMSSLGVVP